VNFSGIKTINVFPLSRIFHFLFIQEGEIELEGREDISEDLPVLNGPPPFWFPSTPFSLRREYSIGKPSGSVPW